MPKRSSLRPAVRRFVPSPPPGAAPGGTHAAARPAAPTAGGGASRALPTLPMVTVGAPPGRPPGASRAVPRLGGLRGVALPPELRRRVPGGVRLTAEAAEVADRIRAALGAAQRKLLDSQRKLQASVAERRAELESRR